MLIVQYRPEESVNIPEDFRKPALLGMTVHSVNVKRLAKQQPHADIDGNHYIGLISSITLHWCNLLMLQALHDHRGLQTWIFLLRQQDFLSVCFPAASSPWHPRWTSTERIWHANSLSFSARL